MPPHLKPRLGAPGLEVNLSAMSRPVMIKGALFKLLIVIAPGALPYNVPYWY